MDNILIVRYLANNHYYYLGVAKNGDVANMKTSDQILAYDEERGMVYKELLSTPEIFTMKEWHGAPVVLLEGKEKLRLARLFYERVIDEEVY